MSKEFAVSIDFKPTRWRKRVENSNIFHMTVSGNNGTYGSQILGVSFRPGRSLSTLTAVNSRRYDDDDDQIKPIKKNIRTIPIQG